MCGNKGRVLFRIVLTVWSLVLGCLCVGKAQSYVETTDRHDNTVKEYATESPHDQTSSYTLTEEELDLIARVISAEARGESYDGQVAVGAVILNRVASEDFPDSVAEVCYQPGAFCGVQDGQINIEPTRSCWKAALEAAMGADPTGGAVYFYNPKTALSEWIRSRPVVVIIGEHWFCV